MNRIGNSEGTVTMTARRFEGHAIPQTAYSGIHNTQAVAIDGNEFVDLPGHAFGKEILGAAEIAESFFTDIGDERNCTGRLHFGFIQALDGGQHDRQPAAIVTDTRAFEDISLARNLRKSLLGKNRIEMRADDEIRPR